MSIWDNIQSTGSNKRAGVATLSGGTVTISNTSIATSDNVMISINGASTTIANQGIIYEDKPNRIANTSFTIKSTNVLDNCTVAWQIIGTY